MDTTAARTPTAVSGQKKTGSATSVEVRADGNEKSLNATMLRNQEEKLSENIARYEAGDYYVTAAIWRPMGGAFGDSYEIGIRNLKTGDFRLLQNRSFNHQSVQEVANAIATLIGDNTQNYTPEWCCEWFGREET